MFQPASGGSILKLFSEILYSSVEEMVSSILGVNFSRGMGTRLLKIICVPNLNSLGWVSSTVIMCHQLLIADDR